MADEPNEPIDDQGTDDSGGGGSSPEPADDLASLDDRSRTLVERANAEAARYRRELRQATSRTSAIERELADARQASESETERLVREAEARGFERAAPMILEAEFAIAAAGRMRNPADAAALVPEDVRAEILGMSDPAARRRRAEEAVNEILEARPYMAVEPDTANGSSGSLVTQGARSRQAPTKTPNDPNAWLRDEARKR